MTNRFGGATGIANSRARGLNSRRGVGGFLTSEARWTIEFRAAMLRDILYATWRRPEMLKKIPNQNPHAVVVSALLTLVGNSS